MPDNPYDDIVAAASGPDPNREALADPRVKGFLDKISKSEGADYDTLVGGSKISDLSHHPNKIGIRASAGPSTAFGRYQITGSTDKSKLAKYSHLDYSPENQDLRAVELLRQTKALDALQQDDEPTAMIRAGKEWASIPGSTLPGRKNAAAFKSDPYDAIVAASGVPQPQRQVTQSQEPPVSPGVDELSAVAAGMNPDTSASAPAVQTSPSAPVAQPAPIQRPLTLNDTAWHLGASPSDVQGWTRRQSRRALQVVTEAAAEDDRKKAAGETIAPPTLAYQNQMREKAGLKPLSYNLRLRPKPGMFERDDLAPYYKPEAGTLPNLNPELRITHSVSGPTADQQANRDAIEKRFQELKAQQDRVQRQYARYGEGESANVKHLIKSDAELRYQAEEDVLVPMRRQAQQAENAHRKIGKVTTDFLNLIEGGVGDPASGIDPSTLANVGRGLTGFAGSTLKQAGRLAQLTPAIALAKEFGLTTPDDAMVSAGRQIEAGAAEQARQTAPQGTYGQVVRTFQEGIGRTTGEVLKFMAGGAILKAAGLSQAALLPTLGALSGADEGVPGIIQGAAGGLAYHYGGAITGPYIGKVGNALLWIAAPAAEAHLVNGTPWAQAIAESAPMGIYAGGIGVGEGVNVKDPSRPEGYRPARLRDIARIAADPTLVVPPVDVRIKPDEQPIVLPGPQQEPGGRPIVAEKAATIAAQMDAMVNRRGSRLGVVIPSGEAGPTKIPKGYMATRTEAGLVIHPVEISPKSIRSIVSEGETYRLEGHPNPDGPGPKRVVVVRAGQDFMANGRLVKAGSELGTSYVDPGNESAAIEELRQQHLPAKPYFDVGGQETAAEAVNARTVETPRGPERRTEHLPLPAGTAEQPTRPVEATENALRGEAAPAQKEVIDRFKGLSNADLEAHIAKVRQQGEARLARLAEKPPKGTRKEIRQALPGRITKGRARLEARMTEAQAELDRRRGGTDTTPSFEQWLKTESGGRAGGIDPASLSAEERATLQGQYDEQYYGRPHHITRQNRRKGTLVPGIKPLPVEAQIPGENITKTITKPTEAPAPWEQPTGDKLFETAPIKVDEQKPVESKARVPQPTRRGPEKGTIEYGRKAVEYQRKTAIDEAAKLLTKPDSPALRGEPVDRNRLLSDIIDRTNNMRLEALNLGVHDKAERATIEQEIPAFTVESLQKEIDDRVREIKAATSAPVTSEGLQKPAVAKAFEAEHPSTTKAASPLTAESAPAPETKPSAKAESPSVREGEKQTDTPEFKRWFGKSKVVDDKGEPSVVYHGTNKSFDSFDTTIRAAKGREIEGAYFSPDKKVAEFFSGAGGQPSQIVEGYLSLQNPYIAKNPAEAMRDMKVTNESELTTSLKQRGYDGAIFNEGFTWKGGTAKEIIAFDSKQIKSTSNSGRFNPESSSLTDFDLEQPSPQGEVVKPEPYQPTEGEYVSWQDDRKTKTGKVEKVMPSGRIKVRVTGKTDTARRVTLAADTEFQPHEKIVTAQTHVTGRPKLRVESDSLETAIRAGGGIKDDGSGELRILKENSKPGTVTKDGKSAEEMTQWLREHGYGRDVFTGTEHGSGIDPVAMVQAAIDDAQSKGGKYYSDQQELDLGEMTPVEQKQYEASQNFLASAKVRRLLDEVANGKATDATYAEVNKIGRQRGLSQDDIDWHVRFAGESSGETPESVQKTSVEQTFTGDKRDDVTYGAKNIGITRERADAAKARLKDKLSPNTLHDITDFVSALPDLAELGAYHIEAGTRKFAEWSRAYLKEFSDKDRKIVEPRLSEIYEKAKSVVKKSSTADSVLRRLAKKQGKELRASTNPRRIEPPATIATPSSATSPKPSIVPVPQRSGTERPAATKATALETTGIARRVEDVRRERLSGDEVQPGGGISGKESVERGRALLRAGKSPEQAVKDFERTGTISADAMALVRAKHEELARAANQAFDKGRHKLDNPEFQKAEKARQDWWEQSVRPMQTEWHKTGMAQQGETAIDTGTFYGLYRAFKEQTGREMTPREEKQAQRLTERVAVTDNQVQDAQKALVAQLDKANSVTDLPSEVRQSVQKFIDQAAQKEARTTTRRQARKALDTEAATIKQNLAAAFQKVKSATGIHPSGLARLDPEGEITKLVLSYAKNRVKAGIIDATQLIDDVHGMVKEFAGDVSRKEVTEALAGMGTTPRKVTPSEWLQVKKNIQGEVKTEGVRETRAQLRKRLESGSNISRTIWNYARENYIDQGAGFDEAVQSIAKDLGATPEQIRRAIVNQPKAKRITDALYTQMSQRRIARQAAERWIKNVDKSPLMKTLEGGADLCFNIATFGHGTVAPLTHAGENIYHPTRWVDYFKNMGRTYKAAYSSATHERYMQDLVNRPNYTTARRGGLKNEPGQFYDEYQSNAARRMFGAIGKIGNRGFDILKVMRQDFFDARWNKLDPEQQTPEMAKVIADLTNHATGAVRATFPSATRVVFFAAPLEASRWARIIGDPVRALSTYSNWNKATPSEKYFANAVTKNVAGFAATYLASLALNQAMLIASKSDDRVNFTDPWKGDWLRHKIKGRAIESTGGLISTIDFLGKLGAAAVGKDRMGKVGDALIHYGRGKLSPAGSTVADVALRSDYSGRPLPQIPYLPKSLSFLQPDAGTAKKPAYTWLEYGLAAHAPIPAAEGLRDFYDEMRKQGVPTDTIRQLIGAALTHKAAAAKATGIGVTSGAAGVKIGREFAQPAPRYNPQALPAPTRRVNP